MPRSMNVQLFPYHAARPSPTRRRIAVVGTGISGLSAAWLLSAGHDVTVYETADRVGGHSNTVEVDGPDGPVPVDTGFIVYNEANYPNLVALFEYLEVATKPSTMSFAASLDGGRFEYSSANLNAFFGQRSNIVRPRFWRMARDIMRFYPEARTIAGRQAVNGVSLGDFLEQRRYSASLADDHILPMCAAIWSTTADKAKAYPLSSFLDFFSSHGLLNPGATQTWRTVEGGSRVYVTRLMAALDGRVQVSNGVRRIGRNGGTVIVEDEHGTRRTFDDVVIGAHADQALRLLDDPSAEESRLLGAFSYTDNLAVLHEDGSLMPRRRRVWSSWNFIGDGTATEDRTLCVTYWMNRLQGLDERQPLFVTLNPVRTPEERSIKATFEYSHPLFNQRALDAQQDLWNLQGGKGTWFCGSYFGYGFHEDGLQSGLAVAEQLGGLRRPWKVRNESGRIQINTRVPDLAL